jgi:hypothetical protein
MERSGQRMNKIKGRTTYEVERCKANDDETLKHKLDTEYPSPAIYGVSSSGSSDREESDQ